MKAFYLTALLCGMATAVSAQMPDYVAELPGGRYTSQASTLDETTRQMANRLRLNEAQYIRLRSANRIKLARMDEIQWMYRDDNSERRAKLSELEAQYEQECRRILTPSQLSLMQEEDRRDTMPKDAGTSGNGLG